MLVRLLCFVCLSEMDISSVVVLVTRAVNGILQHSIIFPTGVVHRVENGWGLTKVAVVLLNGLLW